MKSIPYCPKEIRLLLLLSRSELKVSQVQEVEALLTLPLNWSYILNLAHRSKVVPLVFDNLHGRFAGRTDEANYKLLKKTLERYIRSSLLQTQCMLQLVAYFRKLELKLVPFKGPILSQVAYQKPFHRYFEDLDFLVSAPDFPLVCQELLKIGFVANYLNQPEYYRQAQFAAQDTRTVLDLHFALTPVDCFVQVDTDCLLSELTFFEINGVKIETFSLEDMLIILCVDAAKGYWRSMIRLVDISELLRKNKSLDWVQLRQRAEILNCTSILDIGLFLAEKLLDAPVPEAVSRKIQQDVKFCLDEETLYRQVFKLEVDWMDALKWHRFNMQSLESVSNNALYLYRLGKFSMRNISVLKSKIRT